MSELVRHRSNGLLAGEVMDLGGKRMRRIETPHVPHGWDAGLFFEETTGTLPCGDRPRPGPTIRGLAELDPKTLGLMHGPCYADDRAQALRDLAAAYDARLFTEGVRLHGPRPMGVPPHGE